MSIFGLALMLEFAVIRAGSCVINEMQLGVATGLQANLQRGFNHRTESWEGERNTTITHPSMLLVVTRSPRKIEIT